MNEHENELKNALAENGHLDAAKARQNVVEATSFYDAQLKRSARITWFCFIFVIALLEFAFVGFVLTFSMKAVVAFAVLFLIAIILIMTYSIAFEIKNTKISLLRELKLMRLEKMGLPTEPTIVPARKTASLGTSLWHVLSKRENTAWFLALMLVAIVSNNVTFRNITSQLISCGVTRTNEDQICLSPDGSGIKENKVSYRYQGGFIPLNTLTLLSSDPSYTITQWLDAQGRDLPITVSTDGPHRQFTVQFAEPIMPGDQINYTTIAERKNMATKEGDVWTYRGGYKIGGPGQTFVWEKIKLPQGAEIVSIEPKPAQQIVQDGITTIRFRTLVDEDHEFQYTIQYRLAPSTTNTTPKP